MRYISLLGLVATIASERPLDSIDSIEEYKIAQMASDICAEQDAIVLHFKRVSENRAEITPELLDSDFLYAPFVLFSYNYETQHWSAEETDSIDYFKRMLKFKESESSYRYAIIGAGSINSSASIKVKMGSLYNTLLVELCK